MAFPSQSCPKVCKQGPSVLTTSGFENNQHILWRFARSIENHQLVIGDNNLRECLFLACISCFDCFDWLQQLTWRSHSERVWHSGRVKKMSPSQRQAYYWCTLFFGGVPFFFEEPTPQKRLSKKEAPIPPIRCGPCAHPGPAKPNSCGTLMRSVKSILQPTRDSNDKRAVQPVRYHLGLPVVTFYPFFGESAPT